MNKCCDIIGVDKIYTEGVFRSLKPFNVFDLPHNIKVPATFFTSKSVSKVIFSVLLIFNRKKTANGVFFKVIELTKHLPYKTKK
jgi:hypothetical protein